MCSYLEWHLNVDPSMLCDFRHRIQQDFAMSNLPEAIQDHHGHWQHKPLFPTILTSLSTQCKVKCMSPTIFFLCSDQSWPLPPPFPPPACSVPKKHGTNPMGTSSSQHHGFQHECPITPYLPPARASAAHTQHDKQVMFFFSQVRALCPPPLTTRAPPCAPLHPEVKVSVPLQGINAHPPDASLLNAFLACPHQSHTHT